MPGSNSNLGLGGGVAGLADMLAAALRGGVKTTLGMPGDLEGLGRMGINAMGGSVDPNSVLPTTQDMDRHLPPLAPMTGGEQSWSPVQDLGGALPLGPSDLLKAGTVLPFLLRNGGKAKSVVEAPAQTIESYMSAIRALPKNPGAMPGNWQAKAWEDMLGEVARESKKRGISTEEFPRAEYDALRDKYGISRINP